jgi:predicted RNA-binding Zn-ribbon protein involved in translation (DUF1610 family)
VTLTCDSCNYPIWTRGCLDGCEHRAHCDCSDPDHHESPDTLADYDLSCGRSVKVHAVDRWIRRNDGTPPVDIGEAWEAALTVGSSSISGTSRLYPPSDLVLVAHGDAVRTALRREWVEDLRMDHLKTCGSCDLPWYPGQTDDCPWCDGTAEPDHNEDAEPMTTTTDTDQNVQESEPARMHDCPVCEEPTIGEGDDDRCKVCRELDRTVDETDEDETGSCDECFRDAEPGSAYCDFHSYLEATEVAHAE